MARYPGARWRPLPEHGKQVQIKPTQLVLHSAVGRGSLYGFFSRSDVVVESTFWTGLDGRTEQYMDSGEKSEAQALGNPRAISVETADNGNPDKFPWTPEQIEALAQLAAWCHRVHGIPLRLCRSFKDPGIGYHRLFKEWNPNTHSCPGDARIKQVPLIIARAKQIVAGDVKPTPPEDELPTPDEILKARTSKLGPGGQAVWDRITGQKGGTPTLEMLVQTAAIQSAEAVQMVRALAAQVAALTAAVSRVGTGDPVSAEAVRKAVRDALDGFSVDLTLDVGR